MCVAHSAILCSQIVDEIQSEKVLPEYVLLTEEEDAPGGLVIFEICRKTFESLKKQDRQLYSVEKVFGGDLVPFDPKTKRPR